MLVSVWFRRQWNTGMCHNVDVDLSVKKDTTYANAINCNNVQAVGSLIKFFCSSVQNSDCEATVRSRMWTDKHAFQTD